MGVPSYGIEAHPFVHRVAQAKLSYVTDPERLNAKAESAFAFARKADAQTAHYPQIIGKCYGLETLAYLDRFRQAVEAEQDGSPEAGLLWMRSCHLYARFPKQAQLRGNMFYQADERPSRRRPKSRCKRRCR